MFWNIFRDSLSTCVGGVIGDAEMKIWSETDGFVAVKNI